jgi:hypothetical protein
MLDSTGRGEKRLQFRCGFQRPKGWWGESKPWEQGRVLRLWLREKENQPCGKGDHALLAARASLDQRGSANISDFTQLFDIHILKLGQLAQHFYWYRTESAAGG